MNSNQKSFDLRLKWLGCACFEMDFGDITIVNDPWITDNKHTELTWEAVEKCDYITLTHGHYDHTLDIPALVNKFSPFILCGENTALPLMKWADLNPMTVYPMQPGLELNLDAVKVKALFGRHNPLPGTVNERAEGAKVHPVNGSHPCLAELSFWGDFEYRNFLFTTPNGTKILLWGNKLTLPEQRNTLREEKPDVLVIQITTPTAPVDAAKMCAELGCKVVIPNHTDFPKNYSVLAAEFGEALAQYAPETKYIVPEYGKWIEINVGK